MLLLDWLDHPRRHSNGIRDVPMTRISPFECSSTQISKQNTALRVYKNQPIKWFCKFSGTRSYAIHTNKNLCGRDGRTICGPQCVPKSTYVTLVHNRKQKFFYFGCSLVRRFYCKIKKLHLITGRTDRQTECDAICGPLLGRRAA